jgi:hypothetical protein
LRLDLDEKDRLLRRSEEEPISVGIGGAVISVSFTLMEVFRRSTEPGKRYQIILLSIGGEENEGDNLMALVSSQSP